MTGNPNPIPSGYKGLDYSTFQVDRYDGFIIPASGSQYAMSFEGFGNISVHEEYVPSIGIINTTELYFFCMSGANGYTE